MSSYQQRQTQAVPSRSTGRGGGKPPADLQSLMGNSATHDLQSQGGHGHGEEEMQGDLWGWLHENTGWSWTDSLSSWWTGLWGGDQEIDTPSPAIDTPSPEIVTPAPVVDEPVKDVEVPDPEKKQDPPAPEVMEPTIDRTDTISRGMKGAVISGGAEIEVRDADSVEAGVTGKIADGKPVEVTEVSGDWIKVEYRVPGNKEEQGWVRRSVFSDQPGLFKDDENPGMMEDHIWQLYEKDDVLPEAGQLKGTDIKQGGLADCYFIAAMIAVGNARPNFLEESFRYNESTGLYEVRFFEEQGYDYRSGTTNYDEVWVEVDGYLPTDGDRTAYARSNPELWGALMEKAYAKWQGGFDAIGDGGYGSKAMAHLSGMESESQTPSRMDADQVLAFFTKAQEEGRAIYAGTQSSWESDKQTPLSGSAAGPYTGDVKQIHDWNEIKPGSLTVNDVGSGAAGRARDTGSDGSKTASIVGGGVSKGEVDYSKPGSIELTYRDGQAPEKAEDLEVGFNFKGMIAPQYQLVGWHGYAFKEIVDGKLQFHNPWGSWQPKPITPEDFTKYFSSCATNLVPQAKAAQDTEG